MTVALGVTPGGAVTFDTNHLASDDVRVCPTRLSNPSVAVNGYRVFSSNWRGNLGADASRIPEGFLARTEVPGCVASVVVPGRD